MASLLEMSVLIEFLESQFDCLLNFAHLLLKLLLKGLKLIPLKFFLLQPMHLGLHLLLQLLKLQFDRTSLSV